MGRDLAELVEQGIVISFNPRARVGRDILRIALSTPAVCAFQSTRPRGARRTLAMAEIGAVPCFNPRARVGRDFNETVSQLGIEVRFNPRARVGRDSSAYLHAYLHTAFQSTRPRGARRTSCEKLQSLPTCFNPRARVGRDQSISCDTHQFFVSIHAPAWGATAAMHKLRASQDLFQSTRPRGARPVTRAGNSRKR